MDKESYILSEFRITGFSDFHHPEKIENARFWKLEQFSPSPEDRNRSSFRNVIFSTF
jgi:hypothetical protein